MSISNWDIRMMALAQFIATWSKDRGRKVGAVIVGPDNEIRSTGYNGIPRGVNDDVEVRHEAASGEKYLWVSHAERNAIYNAARAGTSTEGCSIYVEIMPCMDCARAIVQAGIQEVVISRQRMSQYSSAQYEEHFRNVETLFDEAGVSFRQVDLG